MAGEAVVSYRMPPPAAADLVDWPTSFGTRFAVFVDVEEEFDWSAPLDGANRATTAIRALPDAHRRFSALGIPLICMVDHPVAIDAAAVDILRRMREDGRTAIGAQLHTWVTPPFAARRPGDTYAGNLAAELEAGKLDELTCALTDAFGDAPTIFRSGRYGLGPRSLALLAERGYRLDSSVRARYDYSPDGGPDFSRIGNAAYRSRGIVELPLTTVFTGALNHHGHRLYRALGSIPKARGLAARTGLLRRIALTPEDMPIDDAIAAVDIALAQGTRLLNFSFHSPSLEPGHTPYVRTSDDLAGFGTWWDRMATHLATRGVTSVSLADILVALRLAPPPATT